MRLNPQWVEEVGRITNACPYFVLQSMTIVGLEIGRSRIEIDLAQKHLQPFGVTHGGVFATIIDAAAFWAVFSEAPQGTAMTTVDLKLNYLAPAVNGKLIAEGRTVKIGRTLGLGEAKVFNEDGKLLAHGSSTLITAPGLQFESEGALPAKFLRNGDEEWTHT
jgi:uncharacterized protein (TIGR00369 family)